MIFKKRPSFLFYFAVIFVGLLSPFYFIFKFHHSTSDRTVSSTSSVLNFDDLWNWAQKNQPSSRDEFLELLPRELKNKFTFIHDENPQAIQVSTPLKPRVIAFNKTLFYTFDGFYHPESDEAIEVMDFDQRTSQFRFFEIIPKNGFQKRPEENPLKCLRCHGLQSPHPLWNEYANWPRAYGGGDDYIRENDKKSEWFTKFKNKNLVTPYSYLVFLREDLSSPYRTFISSDFNQTKNNYSLRPNNVLTKTITRLSAKRLYVFIKSKLSPDSFKEFRNLYLFAGLECEESDLKNLLYALSKKIGLSTLDWNHTFFNEEYSYSDGVGYIETFLGAHFAKDFLLDYPQAKSDFKFATLKSSSLEYQVNKDELSNSILANLDELGVDFNFRQNRNRACKWVKKELQKNGRPHFFRINKAPVFTEMQTLFNRCLSCHDGSTSLAPELALQSSEYIQKNWDTLYRRITSGDLQKRMPPEGYESKNIQKEFIEYLKNL